MRLPVAFTCFAGALALVVACSEDPPPAGSSSSSGGSSGAPDAGAVIEEDAGSDEDAASGRDGSGPTPTKKTSVEATLNQVVRTLDESQYGVTKADDTLFFEVNEGGVLECPEKETPKRKLIVRDVPQGAPGTKFTKADGIGVSLIDFTGDQITTPNPSTTASAVTVTIVNIVVDASVELEVDATFPEGTVKGRIYSTHCAGMDE